MREFEQRTSYLEQRSWPRGVVVNMPACHAGDRRFKSDRGRHNGYSKFVIRGSKGEE